MKSTVNFKKGNGIVVELKEGTAIVSLPLSVKEFRAIFESTNDEELARKYIAYAVNYGHYGSFVNLHGLTGNEKHRAICANLGLPEAYKPNTLVKKAIKKVEEEFLHGIFGTFKEVRKSYELTRESMVIINNLTHKSITLLKKQDVSTIDDVKAINSLTGLLMNQLSEIRNMVATVSDDVDKIKAIEDRLLIIEERKIVPRGADRVPKSAM